MAKVSVIIPARGCKFLYPTVEDLFAKATGEIEVIVMADGEWPDPPLESHDNLVIVHRGSVHGLQTNINAAARIATGEYIMKCDDHCMFGEGFDEILQADCEPNWLAVPSRYSLDADKWERTRGPVDYLMLTFPYHYDNVYGTGFHGKKWKGPTGDNGSFWHLEKERKHILIDDIIIFQGSSWFMPRQLFFDLGCLDDVNHYFTQEAEELSFKVWLSGGRVIRNKKTWYAHLHKGNKHGRGFRMSKRRIVETEIYSTDFWMNNKWPGQIHKMEWLMNKFLPMDGWPDDWQNPKYAEEFVHPRADLLEGGK
jgi:glycosyltransferase involved in cell wall biosynthesis